MPHVSKNANFSEKRIKNARLATLVLTLFDPPFLFFSPFSPLPPPHRQPRPLLFPLPAPIAASEQDSPNFCLKTKGNQCLVTKLWQMPPHGRSKGQKLLHKEAPHLMAGLLFTQRGSLKLCTFLRQGGKEKEPEANSPTKQRFLDIFFSTSQSILQVALRTILRILLTFRAKVHFLIEKVIQPSQLFENSYATSES